MIFLILKTILFIISGISIIFSMFLFFRNLKSVKKIIFITLLMLSSFDVFVTLYVELDIWVIFPHLLFTNWVIPFVYGPLIFLYFLFDFFPESKLKWFHFIYFLPFIFMLVLNGPTIAENSHEKALLYKQLKENNIPYLANDLEWIAHSIYDTTFIILVYLIARIKLLQIKIVKKLGLWAYLAVFTLQLVYIILDFFFCFSYRQNLCYLVLIWFVTLGTLIFKKELSLKIINNSK